MEQLGVGIYQLACDASPHKQQINEWLNEGRANIWISKNLKNMFGENISDKSVAKYRKYRDEQLHKDLETDPDYIAKMQLMNDNLSGSIGKLRSVDAIGALCDTIEQCTSMLQDAYMKGVEIEDVKDMRMIQQSLLDAVRIYGDTIVKAQKIQEVAQNPELLRPQVVNINVRSVLTDMLKGMVSSGGQPNFEFIDGLRNAKATTGSNLVYDGGGFSGDIIECGSSELDGDEEDIEG